MAAIPRLPDITDKTEHKKLIAHLREFASSVSAAFGALSMPSFTKAGDAIRGNLDAWPIKVTFTASDSDTLVSHSLGRIPAGFVVTDLRGIAAGGTRAPGHITISTGERASTESGIYLRATFAAPINQVKMEGYVYPSAGSKK